MIVAPCKDCKDRHTACHSSCERFIEFRKKKDEEARRRNEYIENKYPSRSLKYGIGGKPR